MGDYRIIPRIESLPRPTDADPERTVDVHVIGPESSSPGRDCYLANRSDSGDLRGRYRTATRYIFRFGSPWPINVLVYHESFETAHEIAANWLLDVFPSHDISDQVTEAYNEALSERGYASDADGIPDEIVEECQSEAESDASCDGNGRWYSNDWTYVECTDRTDLEQFLYPPGIRWSRGVGDGCIVRHPTYRPDRIDYRPDYDHAATMARIAAEAERSLWGSVRVACILGMRGDLRREVQGPIGISPAGAIKIIDAIDAGGLS